MSHLRLTQLFVGLVAGGSVGPDEPGLHQRLAMAGARYGDDPVIARLLPVARLRVEEAEDRAFLAGVIDGTVDRLSELTFPRMEPLFSKYAEGSEMYGLLEAAAEAFGNAVQEAASEALAELVIELARRGHPGDR